MSSDSLSSNDQSAGLRAEQQQRNNPNNRDIETQMALLNFTNEIKEKNV
jgi:hypothetical protein